MSLLFYMFQKSILNIFALCQEKGIILMDGPPPLKENSAKINIFESFRYGSITKISRIFVQEVA